MDKDLNHFSLWDTFSEMVYSSTLNKSHLVGRGEELHQDELYEISENGLAKIYVFENDEDHFFYQMQKENVNYLLPRRYHKDLPLVPNLWIDMKLKESDRKLWRFVQEYDTFKIPETPVEDIAAWLKTFNPRNHSNPPAQTILKAISLCRGLKIAVCGDYSIGKNAYYNIKSSIQNDCFSGLKNCTEAFFHKVCLFNDDINIDEITTWTKTKIQAIEDKLATYGDQSTKSHKHALDNKKSNEMIRNITDKSFVITFNPYDEKRHPRYFGENMGNPGKITDRYPFIYLSGKDIDYTENPKAGTQEGIVKDNIDEYKKFASEYMYVRNNYHKYIHGYDRSKILFQGRQLTNITPLYDFLDAMSNDKAIFDYYVDFLNDAKKAYDDMVKGHYVKSPETSGVFEEFIGEDM